MRVSSNPESVCGGFVYTHRTSYPFHRRQVLFSSRRSTFHNPSRLYGTSHRVSSRVKCTLQPSGNEGPAKDKTDPGNGSSRKYFALYETWRNPTWLRLRSRDIIVKRSAQVPRLMDSQVLLELPQEPFFLKLSCSVVLLSLFGLLSVAYLRFNTYARSLLHNNVSSSMSRDLTIGRVMRCNPVTGIRLKDVHLAPSAEHPTAPVIFATYVDINLSGFLHCIFTRRPLSLNVTLRGGEIQVSQVIVDGPKNEPLGQWDPGLYFDQNQLSVNQEMSQTFFNVLRFVQPGHFRVQDANLFLQPANFLDYGHGDEVIEIQGFSGELTFPHFKEAGRNNFALFEMDGDFEANAKGTPAEGGSIQVQCCMSGGDLVKLKPEDPMINLRVIGERVHANRVASFLSLPFRADHGVCSADITMEFLYKSSSLVPLMRGEAQLDDVGLRFHPDPKTPMFQRINGKLRFEGKTLFLDGPTGDLGTLPMTVVGDIHLEEGYNLMSYVRPVDVNNIINTFDVDKFVPVVGLVSGEAQLSGSLDEPVIAGWADSVGQNSVFDQLPIEHAHVSFQWDAIAGILKFSEIEARVHGGGSICGSGSLLFDMTKESPYGISQKEHSLRSPKSLCWKSSSKHRILLLPPLPRDALEIDEQAPFRPYDSMRFDFTVTDVDGSILIKQYGGAHGKMASESIGLVSGDGVLAGHMEDPNCRVTWKSTTPPPFIHLNVKSPDSIGERNIDSAPPKEKRREDKVVETSKKVKSVSNEDIHSRPQLLAKTGEKITDDSFGGGDYRGLVYIKLGDLPDARRVKIRTVVKNLDARRLVWADPALQKSVAHAPHLKLSMDSYFKGVMSQRPTTILGENINPRTPRMELLGVDGALAVRNLTLNNIKFESIMSGSFSFSVSDFSLSIKQVAGSTMDKAANGRRSVPRNEVADTKSVDELTIAASVKGTADFCFRHGNSEVVTSVSRDEQSHRRAVLFARNFAIEDFVGGNDGPSSGKTLSGVINADMSLDLSSKRGDGKFSLEQPRVGPMSFSSVTGKLVWRDQDLYLEGGTVKYRRSVYEIIARCSTLMSEKGDFEWEVNVNIPRASIQDVATLVKSGNDVATAMQNPADKISNGRREYSGGPMWIQRLSRSGSGSEDKVLYEWEVPQTIPFSDQMEWFHQYLEDKENILKLSMAQALDEAAMDHPSLFGDVDGNISGRVTLKYNSKSSEVRSVPSSANTILQAILDQLTRTSFSFQLDGRSWTVGPARLNDVKLAGTYEDGILNVGPFTFEENMDLGQKCLGVSRTRGRLMFPRSFTGHQ